MGPDLEKRFFLQTDASSRGLGAVLSQKYTDPTTGKETDRPVAYYSKKLTKPEKNYAATQQECLAIVKGVEHFKTYLSEEFTIITDHACLRYLQTLKDQTGRLGRWALRLQPYVYTIEHRPGPTNGNADGLSRQAWEEDTD